MLGIGSLSWITVLVALIVIFISDSIIRAFRDPLRSIPGPWLARFTRLWYFRGAANGSFPWKNVELHKKLGPVVRLSPYEYSIDDPDAAKIIYSTGSKFYKSTWYEGWNAPDPNMWKDLFSVRDPKLHASHRRTVGSFYTMSSWSQMEKGVNQTIALLLDKFRNLASTGEEFDLQHWAQCYAFDTIMLITLNKRFGFLDDGDDKGLFAAIEQFNGMATSGGFFPFLMKRFMGFVWSLNLPTPLDVPVEMVNSSIREHKALHEARLKAEANGKGTARAESQIANDDKNKDNSLEDMNLFARATAAHFDDPEKFPEGAIFTMGMMNLGAGSDTTSISLSATLHHLYMAPKILQNLRSEVSKARKDNNITENENLPFAIAQKLPYLQAILKESTRLHAATGLPMSRVVPDGGAVLAGTFFPAGTFVGINSWVAHYNSSVYGDDPAEFRPERWLPFQSFSSTAIPHDELPKAEKDRLTRMDQYYLAFGMGSRSCIGRNISMIEIAKVVPELIWRFDFLPVNFSSVDKNDKIRRDLGGRDGSGLETRGTWFVKQTNLKYRVKLRS